MSSVACNSLGCDETFSNFVADVGDDNDLASLKLDLKPSTLSAIIEAQKEQVYISEQNKLDYESR